MYVELFNLLIFIACNIRYVFLSFAWIKTITIISSSMKQPAFSYPFLDASLSHFASLTLQFDSPYQITPWWRKTLQQNDQFNPLLGLGPFNPQTNTPTITLPRLPQDL